MEKVPQPQEKFVRHTWFNGQTKGQRGKNTKEKHFEIDIEKQPCGDLALSFRESLIHGLEFLLIWSDLFIVHLQYVLTWGCELFSGKISIGLISLMLCYDIFYMINIFFNLCTLNLSSLKNMISQTCAPLYLIVDRYGKYFYVMNLWGNSI